MYKLYCYEDELKRELEKVAFEKEKRLQNRIISLSDIINQMKKEENKALSKSKK